MQSFLFDSSHCALPESIRYGKVRNLRFQRGTIVCLCSRWWKFVRSLMFPQTFAHFERQVQARKIWIRRFEQLYNAHALTIVIEPAVVLHASPEHLLTGMPKGRVPEIMGERDRVRQVLVQSQRARDGGADRRDL